jgi:hypothetical protein
MHARILAALCAVSGLSAILSCDGDTGNPNEPSTGLLQITTATTGETPAGTGYSYVLDNNPPKPIGFNTTIQLRGLSAGMHTVELTNVPQACSVSGQNPVTANTGDVLADVAFDVSCVAPGIGNIEVTAATSGPGADPDYGLLLDGHDRGTISANGTQVLPGDSAGIHAAGLNGIPANCQAAEENPQPIALLADETANLTFTVTCSLPPAQAGFLNITASTTGTDPDGYLVSVDNGAVQPLSLNGAMTIGNVASGSHTIELSGIHPNCSVTGLNPVTVIVSADMATGSDFEIDCAAAQAN